MLFYLFLDVFGDSGFDGQVNDRRWNLRPRRRCFQPTGVRRAFRSVCG
ncbi:MAG: hypothetical protein MZV64_60265 [Ignavibacteriales bacterium]|nr:hypothetical protein [Ignavibacteriales bacterium]